MRLLSVSFAPLGKAALTAVDVLLVTASVTFGLRWLAGRRTPDVPGEPRWIFVVSSVDLPLLQDELQRQAFAENYALLAVEDVLASEIKIVSDHLRTIVTVGPEVTGAAGIGQWLEGARAQGLLVMDIAEFYEKNWN